MLQLYNVNKNKIGGLKYYKDYLIESVLQTGDKTLSFLYPANLSNEIVEEGYIRTKQDEFVIKEISNKGEFKSIKAVLNIEEIEGEPWKVFEVTNKSIDECIALAIAGTGWTIGTCNITKRRTVKKTNCSAWEIIQEAKEIFLAEIEFDTLNKKINIFQKRGNDKGTYFIDTLNLKELETQGNTYSFFTRLIAIGKDDIEVTVENFEYVNKKKTGIWKDERYTKIDSLREDAVAKLSEMAKPYRAYSASVVDLANISEEYKDILSYDLGDVITLISKSNGIKEKQRIVKIQRYEDEPERNTCEIANTTLRFEDIQRDLLDTTDTVNNITSDNGTVSDAAIESLDYSKLKNVSIQTTQIQDAAITTAKIGKAQITSAEIAEATIDKANIKQAFIEEIETTSLSAEKAKIKIAEIENLLAGNVSAEIGQLIHLTAKNFVAENGIFSSAMIKDLDVGKLNAGVINTDKIEIKSETGGIEIVGETQQWKDENNKVRMIAGRDASNKFIFAIFDETGTGVLIDSTGVKEKALADGVIKNNMVADGAIGGKKIDYSSLVSEWNKEENTSTLKSSKVELDGTGQTLNISFNNLTSKVNQVEKDVNYSVEIVSTNGAIFKNGQISTKLIAVVRKGTTDITSTLDSSKFKWTRISEDKVGDTAWNTSHFGGTKEITITKNDVLNRATFNCEISE